MSKAREIAEERFAKGEITEEELATILKKLPNSSDIKKEESMLEEIGSLIGGVLIIGFLIYYFFGSFSNSDSVDSTGQPSASDITKSNIRHNGKTYGSSLDKIKIDIANTGTYSGDLLLWSLNETRDIKGCLHVVEMRPGTLKDVSMVCNLNNNKRGANFYITHTWAVNKPGEAALAKRIPVNWEK